MTDDRFDLLVKMRRHLHAHPELSFEEHRTAEYVESVLLEFGIRGFERIAGTGITFLLEGRDSGPTVALRADMDALPIQEANETDYKSKNPGVMHACGHDAHTASLLGVARNLIDLKDSFTGSVRFIFQPGEEKAPGGASLVIKEGIFKSQPPFAILGQHVLPRMPAGSVGFRSGTYMASSDEIRLTVEGKGGHAAAPDILVDPVPIACQIVTALQQVISRHAPPGEPSVLSFGRFLAKGSTNVIPDMVEIAGTFRTFDSGWREKALISVDRVASGIAKSMGATCHVKIDRGYPSLFNDEQLTARGIEAAEQFLGPKHVKPLDQWMGSEDFAFYGREIPGCFYRFGVGSPDGEPVRGVHTPTFDICEGSLRVSTGFMTYLTLKLLNEWEPNS